MDASRLGATGRGHLDETRLWAQRSSQKGQQVYHVLEPRDDLLFYKVKRGRTSDEKRYVGVAHVGEKFELSPVLAEVLFNTRWPRWRIR